MPISNRLSMNQGGSWQQSIRTKVFSNSTALFLAWNQLLPSSRKQWLCSGSSQWYTLYGIRHMINVFMLFYNAFKNGVSAFNLINAISMFQRSNIWVCFISTNGTKANPYRNSFTSPYIAEPEGCSIFKLLWEICASPSAQNRSEKSSAG